MTRTAHAQWAIHLAVEIDRYVPFCGAFFRASAERQQVIAAYLASQSPFPSEMTNVGEFLLRAKHRSILEAAHGHYVEGSRGALRRAGEFVLEERFYTLLYRLLIDPPNGATRRAIARLPRLSLPHLVALERLPEPISYPEITETLVSSSVEADDAAKAFHLLSACGVDTRSLVASLRRVKSGREFGAVWRSYLADILAPAHPVAETEWYSPLLTPRCLARIALKYRNCCRRYQIDLLDPAAGHAFAEVRHGKEGAVVHLQRDGHGWRLEGLFGPRNSRPGHTLRHLVDEHLKAHGVRIIQSRRRAASEWDALRRLGVEPFFDFDLE